MDALVGRLVFWWVRALELTLPLREYVSEWVVVRMCVFVFIPVCICVQVWISGWTTHPRIDVSVYVHVFVFVCVIVRA